MHLSSVIVALAAGADAAASGAARRQECSSVLENGSFETGASPWTVTGGARVAANTDTNAWGFTATDGDHFAILESSNSNATSSLVQSVSELSFTSQWTLSFDWDYLFIATGHGPPSIQCTLKASFLDGFEVAGWYRRAAMGGNGHVEETFSINFGAADLTIALSCEGDSIGVEHNAGVAIDNVKFTEVC